MAYREQKPFNFREWLVRPDVGSGLTIASGLAFLLVCMLLPLVGKAGVHTDHYVKNWITFFMVLLITLGLSGLALKSKTDRRRADQSPKPVFTWMVFGASVFLMAALVLGLLKI